MSTWAVGDVQGCLASLERLLDTIGWREGRDRLWLVGDLVNRGPDSLGVLRRLIDLGSAVTAVLGNHDLHLLAAANGTRRVRGADTFGDVLAAPDRDALLAWLAARPLAHRAQVADRSWLMLHAGLHPAWSVEQTLTLAAEAGAALVGPAGDWRDAPLLQALGGCAPPAWSPALEGSRRLVSSVAWLTRARGCWPDGTLLKDFTGPPEELPEGALPWWDLPHRTSAGQALVCGHWAAAGARREGLVRALDSGCVWGGALSALRLEDDELVSVPPAEA